MQHVDSWSWLVSSAPRQEHLLWVMNSSAWIPLEGCCAGLSAFSWVKGRSSSYCRAWNCPSCEAEWSTHRRTESNRIEQIRTESSKTEIEDCTLRSAQTREPGNGIVALSQECFLSASSWITHSINASIPPIIQHWAEKYMPLQSAVSWQSWVHGVHLLSCYSSGRGSPSSRNAYRLDTDTIVIVN